MESALDTLSAVSGISKPEINAIWAAVRANHARLDACAGPHDFSEVTKRTGQVPREYRCSKCGGTIDSVNRNWYLDGLKHGGK
jgi:hypothetical protein